MLVILTALKLKSSVIKGLQKADKKDVYHM